MAAKPICFPVWNGVGNVTLTGKMAAAIIITVRNGLFKCTYSPSVNIAYIISAGES